MPPSLVLLILLFVTAYIHINSLDLTLEFKRMFLVRIPGSLRVFVRVNVNVVFPFFLFFFFSFVRLFLLIVVI